MKACRKWELTKETVLSNGEQNMSEVRTVYLDYSFVVTVRAKRPGMFMYVWWMWYDVWWRWSPILATWCRVNSFERSNAGKDGVRGEGSRIEDEGRGLDGITNSTDEFEQPSSKDKKLWHTAVQRSHIVGPDLATEQQHKECVWKCIENDCTCK